MRRCARLLILTTIAAMVVSVHSIPPQYPSARGVLERYFAALAAKQVEESMQFFTPAAKISVFDYGCNPLMTVPEATQYFNSTIAWFSLLHRSLGTVVQNGNIFSASFVDAGFIPEAMRPTGGSWNFLLNSVIHGNLNVYGQIEYLTLHTDFLNATERQRYASLVDNVYAAECSGNATAFLDVFDPNATILYADDIFHPNGTRDSVLISTTPERLAPMVSSLVHCAVLIHEVIAGCGFVVSRATKMFQRTQQVIVHGYSLMVFDASGKVTRWDALSHDFTSS